MRYTLLEMVQRILESMDSDEVNSYADTIESKAVANIIKETYFYLVSRMDLPTTHQFFNLVASGDNTKPVLMTRPNNVLNLDWIKYKHLDSNGDSAWEYVTYVPIENFMESQSGLKESETEVETMTVPFNGVSFEFKFRNDRNPSFYTTIDNNLVFDSYDSVVDTTLQANKTMCYGSVVPTFTMSDNFIPELDPAQYQLLLNEAKSQAFVELKQMGNAHSDRRSNKMFINTQRTKENLPNRNKPKRPDFGRRSV